MLEDAVAYLHEHRERHMEELFRFLRIPSISLDPAGADQLQEAADYSAQMLRDAGLQRVEVLQTQGAPLVYGEWKQAVDAPTVLVYGHYDVQPSGPEERWTAPAFSPQIRSGAIYGRGASDDKGQLFLHVKAIEAILKTGLSPACNIIFLIEGEEETGSAELRSLLLRVTEDGLASATTQMGEEITLDLRVDAVVISDTPFMSPDEPALCVGVRGFCGLLVEVEGPVADLHSGGYGGLVHNPAHALARLLASLHDEDGRVAVANFYKDVEELPMNERAWLRQATPPEEELARQLGVSELFGESGYSALERIWTRPTLDVNAFLAGDCTETARTIIPKAARATVTARLVQGQDPEDIAAALEQHLNQAAPRGVKLRLTRLDEARAWSVAGDEKAHRHALAALLYGFSKPASTIRMGGSIPVVADFAEQLQAQVVLLGFGLPSDQVHAEDEHLELRQFEFGLRTLVYYYHTAWDHD